MTVPLASLPWQVAAYNIVASCTAAPYPESLKIDRMSSIVRSTDARPAMNPPNLIAHPP